MISKLKILAINLSALYGCDCRSLIYNYTFHIVGIENQYHMQDIHFGMVDTSVATDIVPEFGWITHFPFWAFYKGLY